MNQTLGKLLRVGKPLIVTAAVGFVFRVLFQRVRWLCSMYRDHGRGVREIRPVEAIVKRSFTANELLEYNGVQRTDIYVSVKGVVYEVAPQFYGPGQPYHAYAGHEISRCLAKNDITGEEANKDWQPGSSDEELERLDVWVKRFDSKYPVVGWFVWGNGPPGSSAAIVPSGGKQ